MPSRGYWLVLWGLLALSSCSPKPAGRDSSAGAASSPAAAGESPVSPNPTPTPVAPPLAAKAAEAPELESRLESDQAYRALWTTGHRPDLELFLTGVSGLIESCDITGNGEVREELFKPLEKRNLTAAATLVFGIEGRTGALPKAFAQRLADYLAQIGSEPNRGLWRRPPLGDRGPRIDFAALAALLNPKDATIFREFLAAKAQGPFRGTRYDKKMAHPFLTNEREALRRLAALTELTPEEKKRQQYVTLIQPGEAFELGEFRYNVSNVGAHPTVGNGMAQTQASEGALFVVVDYTIENLGRATATGFANDFRVLDDQGREFRPSSDANTALALSGRKRDLVLTELQPGVARKMVTAFEIPVTANWLKLIVPEKGALGSRTAAVALPLPRD